jgi:hypothetical protein
MERLPPRPQASAIFLAVGVEPTRQTPATRLSSYQGCTTWRLPWTILITPLGRPMALKISPIFCMK